MDMSSTPDGTGHDPENPYALTLIEQQVVDLLIAGLTGEEVGNLLGIPMRGVALRRASAMRKCGARNGLHMAHLISISRRANRVREESIVLEDVPSAFAH